MIAFGLALALASAVALNVGYYRQHGAAASMPPLAITRPVRSLRLLFTNLPWLVGLVTGLGGWVLYVAALSIAPLSLVQAATAGGVGVLALLSWRGGRAKATGEVIGVLLALAGLVLLGVSLVGDHRRRTCPALRRSQAGSSSRSPLRRGSSGGASGGLGGALGLAAAGILYAAGDTSTKAVFPGGPRLVFAPAVLALHGLAFVALQLGLQRGRPLETAGSANLLTNALPILAGSVFYAEPLGTGAGEILRLLSFASVVADALALALAQAPIRPPRDDPSPGSRARAAQARARPGAGRCAASCDGGAMIDPARRARGRDPSAADFDACVPRATSCPSGSTGERIRGRGQRPSAATACGNWSSRTYTRYPNAPRPSVTPVDA